MPNYGLVINSTYDPMSFEDYAKPFQEYATVYRDMADAYDLLEMEASLWEKLALSQKDSEANLIYLNYATLLKLAANDLAENGLSIKTRGTLSKMRKDYMSTIKPMEDAYNYIGETVKRQLDIMGRNPNVVFDVDFSKDVSIMDVMRDPHKSFNYIDLETVKTDALKAALAMSSRNITISASDLGTAYKMIENGYTIPDIMPYLIPQTTSGDGKTQSSGYEEIANLYNTLRTKYDQYGGDKVSNAIFIGMLQGLSGHAEPILTGSRAGTSSGGSGSGSSGSSDIPLATYYIIKDKYGNIKYTTGTLPVIGQNEEDPEWLFVNSKGERIGVSIANNTATNTLYARKSSGNSYFIIDESTGLPYLNPDGTVMTYNPSKQTFNTNTIQVTDNPQHLISQLDKKYTIEDDVLTKTLLIETSSMDNTKNIGVPATDTDISELSRILVGVTLNPDLQDIYVTKNGADKITSVYVSDKKPSDINIKNTDNTY